MSHVFLRWTWHFYTRRMSIQSSCYEGHTNISQTFIKSPRSNVADFHIKFCSKSLLYECVIEHILWISHNGGRLKIEFLTVANVLKNLCKGNARNTQAIWDAPMTLGNGFSLLAACTHFLAITCISLLYIFLFKLIPFPPGNVCFLTLPESGHEQRKLKVNMLIFLKGQTVSENSKHLSQPETRRITFPLHILRSFKD